MKTLIFALIFASSAVMADDYNLPEFPELPALDSQSPRLYSADGHYLGNVNTNKYDPNSISNPYGRYGNPYSPDSINNPYGRYGNPYSAQSVRNPYGK